MKRKFLINMFSKMNNSVGAEIGVWTGSFSSRLIECARPSEFHAIDPWRFDAYANKAYGANIRDQKQMDVMFLSAKKMMEKSAEISGTVLHVHRETSERASANFSNEFFDWIYIDGNHAYEYVKQDMLLYLPKVKLGGLLTGDDVCWTGYGKGKPVQRAVNELKKDDRVEFVEVRNDQFIFRKIK